MERRDFWRWCEDLSNHRNGCRSDGKQSHRRKRNGAIRIRYRSSHDERIGRAQSRIDRDGDLPNERHENRSSESGTLTSILSLRGGGKASPEKENAELRKSSRAGAEHPTPNVEFRFSAAVGGANWMQRHVALRQAPRTRRLIEKATNVRPMSIKISGQGFVSKAENTAIVACSTKRKPNQQTNAIFNPAIALLALRCEISQANV